MEKSRKRERKDKRITRLARLIVDFCCRIKKDDKVLIKADLPAKELVLELYKQVLRKGAYPILEWGVEGIAPVYYKNASYKQIKKYPKISEYIHKSMDAFIFIRAPINRSECKDCDIKKIVLRHKIAEKVSRIHLKKRYVLLDWPTETLAESAGMSIDRYKDFVFAAYLLDWKKEHKGMQRIKRLLNKSGNIRILGKETDLRFNIKGKNAVINYGPDNMPAGEVFTAIREKTANGYIRFTYPLRYMDQKIANIKLWFRNGKVTKAGSTNMKALNALLNADKGSRYIGEFGIGCNPSIRQFTDNLLFDEKISGTIHLALGMSYPECRGRNKSSVHADIVKDMKNGRIFIDGRLAYEKGRFKT